MVDPLDGRTQQQHTWRVDNHSGIDHHQPGCRFAHGITALELLGTVRFRHAEVVGELRTRQGRRNRGNGQVAACLLEMLVGDCLRGIKYRAAAEGDDRSRIGLDAGTQSVAYGEIGHMRWQAGERAHAVADGRLQVLAVQCLKEFHGERHRTADAVVPHGGGDGFQHVVSPDNLFLRQAFQLVHSTSPPCFRMRSGAPIPSRKIGESGSRVRAGFENGASRILDAAHVRMGACRSLFPDEAFKFCRLHKAGACL